MVQRERTFPCGVGILGVFRVPRAVHRTEVRSMDQLIPSLAILVEPLRDCFHPSVFATFQTLLAGWIVCLGPRTISEVWQATGWAAKRHHDTAYAVFRSAAWEWDDLGIVLATLILAHLLPGGVVWIVVDDTLCHKRGPRSPSAASSSTPCSRASGTRRSASASTGSSWGSPSRSPCAPIGITA